MLVYAAICSLDGYVADRDGRWDWSEPDPEVHRFVNDLERGIGTNLYGRRIYEVLSAWETMDDPDPVMQDYAEIWRSSDKVVYSRTLQEVTTARTRIERELDLDEVARLKEDGDVSIGGPELAAHAFRAGLVDRVHLFVAPVIVGGGKRVLPDDVRLDLRLAGSRSFENGTVHLEYVG